MCNIRVQSIFGYTIMLVHTLKDVRSRKRQHRIYALTREDDKIRGDMEVNHKKLDIFIISSMGVGTHVAGADIS